MVTRGGVFAAGQMQMVINAGKRAKKMLDARAYHGNIERADLERARQRVRWCSSIPGILVNCARDAVNWYLRI